MAPRRHRRLDSDGVRQLVRRAIFSSRMLWQSSTPVDGEEGGGEEGGGEEEVGG